MSVASAYSATILDLQVLMTFSLHIFLSDVFIPIRSIKYKVSFTLKSVKFKMKHCLLQGSVMVINLYS